MSASTTAISDGRDMGKVSEDLARLYPEYRQQDRDYLAAMSQKFNLDPVKREIHMLPGRNGKSPMIVIGYQVYIARANETGLLKGWSVALRKGDKEDRDISCTVEILRSDYTNPFQWTVFLKEVAGASPIWMKMPSFMLRKVAISQAFRLCFPEHLGGLPYGEEEII